MIYFCNIKLSSIHLFIHHLSVYASISIEVPAASNLDLSALIMVTIENLRYKVSHSILKTYSFSLSLPISQDVLDSKNGAIRDLQYELARVCKVHLQI